MVRRTQVPSSARTLEDCRYERPITARHHPAKRRWLRCPSALFCAHKMFALAPSCQAGSKSTTPGIPRSAASRRPSLTMLDPAAIERPARGRRHSRLQGSGSSRLGSGRHRMEPYRVRTSRLESIQRHGDQAAGLGSNCLFGRLAVAGGCDRTAPQLTVVKGREPKSSESPFQATWMPMQKSRNAERRTTMVVPVTPIHLAR